MEIRILEDEDLKELIEIYNEFMDQDPDFHPLNEELFRAKYLKLPYCSKDLMLVAESDKGIEGCIIADLDPLVEEKFRRKIAIIDLLIARKEKFEETSELLLNVLINKLRNLNAEEVQVHFLAESFKLLKDFFAERFELSRTWLYMECEPRIFDLEPLPEGMIWETLRFRGRKANAKKWIACYNEAFKDHYGMRPLRYEELKSYLLEESFDPSGYFGIFSLNENRFIAECSCEMEYKRKRSIIWTVGVIEKYRGKGLGTMLVKRAMNWSCEKEAEKVAIHVDEKNKVAFNLYSKLGFKVMRRRLFYSMLL